MVSRVYYYRNCKPSLVLRDDYSLMAGSDDIKSGAVIEEIVWML